MQVNINKEGVKEQVTTKQWVTDAFNNYSLSTGNQGNNGGTPTGKNDTLVVNEPSTVLVVFNDLQNKEDQKVSQ